MGVINKQLIAYILQVAETFMLMSNEMIDSKRPELSQIAG